MARFPIHIKSVLKPFFMVITATRQRAWIDLDSSCVTVRLGWWQDTIPLSAIESVEKMKWSWAYGYGLRIAPEKTLGAVGSSEGVLVMTLKEPREFRVPFRLQMKRVAVSPEDADGFLSAMRAALGSQARGGSRARDALDDGGESESTQQARAAEGAEPNDAPEER